MKLLPRDSVFELCDSAFRLITPAPRSEGGIAVIRLDAIGDFVIWQNYGRLYRERFGSKRLVLFVSVGLVDFAKAFGYWDAVIGIDLRRLYHDIGYRFSVFRMVRACEYEVLVHPVYSRTRRAEAFVGWFHCRQRIALRRPAQTTDSALWSRFDRQYTSLVPVETHRYGEWYRAQELTSSLLGRDVGWVVPNLPVMAELPRSLRAKKYAVIFPGAQSAGRRWPVERFAEIAKWISTNWDLEIVVAGSKAEESLGYSLLTVSGVRGINLCGATSVAELVEVIRSARLVIANETSAAHIAVAVQTPAVVLLGGGHFGRFMPYPEVDAAPKVAFRSMDCFGCDWKCRYAVKPASPWPCVEAISVGDVVDILQRSHWPSLS